MKKFISKNPKETKNIAKKLLKNLKGGEILGLVGNLGGGKTVFVQGLAEVLGIKEIVNSPTFVLIKIYNIKNSKFIQNLKFKIQNLVHIDVYRLESFTQLKEIGVEEYLNKKGCLVVVEWADKVKEIKKYPKYQEIIFEEGKNINERIIKIVD